VNRPQIHRRKSILGFAWQFGGTAVGVLKISQLREYEDWTIGQTSCTIFTWNLSEGQASFDTHKPELRTQIFFSMSSVTIERISLRQINLMPVTAGLSFEWNWEAVHQRQKIHLEIQS
jgi:hypothetical protein